MELHGRPKTVVLDFDGNNERELARITLFRLGVPLRMLASETPLNEGK